MFYSVSCLWPGFVQLKKKWLQEGVKDFNIMDSCEECECDSTDIYTGSLLHSDWPGGNESKDG